MSNNYKYQQQLTASLGSVHIEDDNPHEVAFFIDAIIIDEESVISSILDKNGQELITTGGSLALNIGGLTNPASRLIKVPETWAAKKIKLDSSTPGKVSIYQRSTE